ncbi:site-specific integrase [Streptomyces acidicola]|uniref:site-specific integrase n=1 Tax=Streptomyces acidicola TaxID=2596892 RepID=UPI002AD226F6|nr:site-specific integrase [Streptomyces acidicola]
MVAKLGYEHLRRHDLRHTGLTWFADAGVQVHVLRRIAGHGSLTTTQRYLHPDVQDHGRRGRALRTPQRAARAALAAEPHRCDRLTPVKDAGPQPVPKNDQGPVSDASETGPELRLSPVGTTGFEPATP